MKIKFFTTFLFLSLLVGYSAFSADLFAADVIDSIEEEDRAEIDESASANQAPNLVNESILKISASKKIFIITNENQSFSRGDFISILIANQLVCRALVAKTTATNESGIKIIKIYNSDLWNQLSKKKQVLILKGDDSYYNVKVKVAEKDPKSKKDTDLKIESEEDLFSSTSVGDDDQNMEENSKRLIKPDNILGISYGLIQGRDNSGGSVKYPHISANWAYQPADNIWGEVGVGTNTIRDYPNVNGRGGLDTKLISFSVRLKYTIMAPFYTFVMPYAGFQMVTVDSPGAGVDDPNDPQSSTILSKELELVDDLKRSGPVFGITILRRLVPGWFARFDLGSDIISGGLNLEF